MLDGLLHRNNFRTKCKSAISRTKTRLEVIKKKRNAVQKFLKKDVADLLKSNLDRNAYGRAEGLYIELALTFCYDYVGKCCACISEHLKEMHKQRECPESCKVAVSSLIYAAARFSDLPELRDLRNQFNEKYGSSLDSFVNEEFVEKLKSKPPTSEMKIQLMRDIAREFSITWDPSCLQQQLSADQSMEKSAKPASDRMFKSMSTVAQVNGKQEDSNKLINEEHKVKLKSRRHNSYSKFNANVSEIVEEQNNVKEKSIHTALKNIGSKNKEPDSSNSRHKPGLLGDTMKPIRLRSVRTKFVNSSPSTPTSRTKHEIDVKELRSMWGPQEKSEEEEEVGFDKSKFFNYSANSRNNKKFATPVEKDDYATTPSALPPPPGRRRYLFAQSVPSSPMKESNLSKFMPPDFH